MISIYKRKSSQIRHNIIQIHNSVHVGLTIFCGIFSIVRLNLGECYAKYCQSHMGTIMDLNNVMGPPPPPTPPVGVAYFQ